MCRQSSLAHRRLCPSRGDVLGPGEGVGVLAGGGLDGAGRDLAAEVVDGDDRV